jgi:hypothetical protein
MCRDDHHSVVFCLSKSEHAGGLCQAPRLGEIAGGQSPVTRRTSKRPDRGVQDATWEFHPEPLTELPLDSPGSCHRTKAAAFR